MENMKHHLTPEMLHPLIDLIEKVATKLTNLYNVGNPGNQQAYVYIKNNYCLLDIFLHLIKVACIIHDIYIENLLRNSLIYIMSEIQATKKRM